MWNPIKIEFNNLFAHKNSIYVFKNNECTVIFGKNETDRNLENNGAGKTTLFEAVSIALTNESLRAIKKDSFINREEEECKIVFELFNAVLKKSLKISRQFFRGNKSTKVEIYENDVLNTQIVSVNEANKRVLELIGVSREDLLRYYIVSQDNNYSFFAAGDTEKKEILNRITSADIINPIIEKLEKTFKEKSKEVDNLNNDINNLEYKIGVLNEQRNEVLNGINVDEEIKSLSIKKEKNRYLIKYAKKDLLFVKIEKTKKKKEIGDIVVIDTYELKSEGKKLRSKKDAVSEEIESVKSIRRRIQTELNGKITCPKCKHDFISKSEFNLTVKDAQNAIKEADEEFLKFEKEILILKEKIIDNKRKIEEAEEKELLKVKAEGELKRIEREEKNKIDDITHLFEISKKIEKEKKEAKEKKEDNKMLNSLDSQLLKCKEELKDLKQKIIPIEKEREKIIFWRFNMGSTGFKTYLANKSIKILEGVTNSFLKKFGVDITVLINGYKILKSGDVREKIDIFVSNDGITSDQFMQKSGGERGRVTLAGVLGIQHLINLSSNGRGLNLLLLDECFHGLDSRGQENIIKIFEKSNNTILVITQNVSESFNNENTLFVVKENGISKYL